jgi:hypothetical protein
LKQFERNFALWKSELIPIIWTNSKRSPCEQYFITKKNIFVWKDIEKWDFTIRMKKDFWIYFSLKLNNFWSTFHFINWNLFHDKYFGVLSHFEYHWIRTDNSHINVFITIEWKWKWDLKALRSILVEFIIVYGVYYLKFQDEKGKPNFSYGFSNFLESSTQTKSNT